MWLGNMAALIHHGQQTTQTNLQTDQRRYICAAALIRVGWSFVGENHMLNRLEQLCLLTFAGWEHLQTMN